MPIPAIRYKNPGNVSIPIGGYGSGGGKVAGIRGQPRYAEFPSIELGIRALDANLRNNILYHGLSSIYKLGHSGRYEVPPTQAWVDGVSRWSGIGEHEELIPSDHARMTALRYGVTQTETGGNAAFFGITLSSPPLPGASQGKPAMDESKMEIHAAPPSRPEEPVPGLPGNLPEDGKLLELSLEILKIALILRRDPARSRLEDAIKMVDDLITKEPVLGSPEKRTTA